jgi:hypothetical protein
VGRTAVRVTKPVSVRVSGDGVRKDEVTSDKVTSDEVTSKTGYR